MSHPPSWCRCNYESDSERLTRRPPSLTALQMPTHHIHNCPGWVVCWPTVKTLVAPAISEKRHDVDRLLCSWQSLCGRLWLESLKFLRLSLDSELDWEPINIESGSTVYFYLSRKPLFHIFSLQNYGLKQTGVQLIGVVEGHYLINRTMQGLWEHTALFGLQ